MWSIYFKGNFIKKLSQSLFFTFKVAKSCNGKPKIKWSCCTTGSPCDVGGGDCDKDSHCSGNLICGNNNCRKWGKHWKRSADCCEGIKFHYRRRKYRTHIICQIIFIYDNFDLPNYRASFLLRWRVSMQQFPMYTSRLGVWWHGWLHWWQGWKRMLRYLQCEIKIPSTT